MLEWIKSLFSSKGTTSSKRVVAFMLVIAGIVYAFVKNDPAMAGLLIGSGTALLGVAAITKS